MSRKPGEIFVELDVDYWHDDDVVSAGAEGELLFVRALCFAKKLMTDGRIGEAQLVRLCVGLGDPEALAGRLVEVGLWRRDRRGYRITNFLRRNKSRAQILAGAEERRREGLRGNHKRWHTDRPRSDCEFCSPRAQPSTSPNGSGRPSGKRSGTRSPKPSGGAIPTETETETVPTSPPESPSPVDADRVETAIFAAKGGRPGTPGQVRTMVNLADQLGTDQVTTVLGRHVGSPDPYGRALQELQGHVAQRRAGARTGERRHPPGTYDRVIRRDPEAAHG